MALVLEDDHGKKRKPSPPLSPWGMMGILKGEAPYPDLTEEVERRYLGAPMDTPFSLPTSSDVDPLLHGYEARHPARGIGPRPNTLLDPMKVKDLHDRIAEDMGLSGYHLPIEVIPHLDTTEKINGDYTDSTGKTRIDDSAYRAGTIFHELAHAADHTLNNYSISQAANEPSNATAYETHMRHFRNPNKDMAEMLQAQRLIEAGGKVRPDTYKKFPALHDVNPLSSNRLASPWMQVTPEPSYEWNSNVELESKPYEKPPSWLWNAIRGL